MPFSRLTSRTPTVLVVDDQEANVRLAGSVLADAGLEVMPALSGAQALARAAARPPDLVLLDQRMPEMGGMEVLEVLRTRAETAAVPVIILTASTEHDDLVRAFERGAVDFITKPFVAEELLARVRTHLELKLTRDHLQRVAREREELAAIVAHDLKNPLSSILFGARMAQREGLSPERVQRLAGSIVASAESAMSFIGRYLERRADGELIRTFRREPVDLAESARGVIGTLALAAESKDQQVQLRVRDAVQVAGDAAGVESVITHLLSNAIKYSPAGTSIRVTVAAGAPGNGRLSVADEGPGVSESDRKRLFQRFVRLSAQPTAAESSTGLGLALAWQDVAQMQGHLWHEPGTPSGSVFAFELPLVAVDPAATP